MKLLIPSVLALAMAGLFDSAAQAADQGPAKVRAASDLHQAASPVAHKKPRHHRKRRRPTALSDRARTPPPPPPVEMSGAIATQPKTDPRPKP